MKPEKPDYRRGQVKMGSEASNAAGGPLDNQPMQGKGEGYGMDGKKGMEKKQKEGWPKS